MMFSDFIAYAQVSSDQTLDGILSRIMYYIVNPFIILLFTLATVIFVWGVIKYIKNAGDQTKRAEGQQHMLWGLVGFVIMVGVYGIITILTQFFGINNVTVTKEKFEVREQAIPTVIIRKFDLPKK